MITVLSPLDYHLLPHDPGPAKCVVVNIESDKINGMLAYHDIPHLGCFYVDNPRQGIGQKLLERMELIVPEYFTFPSTDASKAFFLKRGLTKLDNLEVYKKCLR